MSAERYKRVDYGAVARFKHEHVPKLIEHAEKKIAEVQRWEIEAICHRLKKLERHERALDYIMTGLIGVIFGALGFAIWSGLVL